MTYSKILKHFCSKCDEGTSHNIATQSSVLCTDPVYQCISLCHDFRCLLCYDEMHSLASSASFATFSQLHSCSFSYCFSKEGLLLGFCMM